ncbi:MAG: adenylate kinase [Bdellovibrionales bacterium]|nr:adenylate kinase [Bdellovibrionales bacterium]
MYYCLMGPPGVGKGTQAVFLSEKYGLEHISTGNLLREAVRQKTKLGLQAQNYMNQGLLVPDNLMIALVEEVFQKGFILDGFPRTVPQAEALDSLVKRKGLALDQVILLTLDEEELVKRLTGRRVAPKSGRVYHLYFSPPKKEGVCDETGEPLIQREDDKLEIVRPRLQRYFVEQSPLTAYYKEKGLIREISAEGSPEEVRQRLEECLKKN